MTAGPFTVSYVPKQANGLLQSRKPVWKSTSRKIPNRSTLLFSQTSYSAPGRMHFHRVIVDSNDSRRSSAVPVWCAGAKPFLLHPKFGIAINSGRTPAVLPRQRHLADAWQGRSHRAPHARCVDALQRARLTLITAMEMEGTSADGLTCRGGRLGQIRSQRSDRAVLVAVLHGPHPL